MKNFTLLLLMIVAMAVTMTVVPLARAATQAVTINPAVEPLVNTFLPVAKGVNQVGNSPAWKANSTTLGVPTYTESLETLTPGANVSLNWLTGRTKRITLGQNTTFTFANTPTVATNLQRMLVGVVGDGVFTVTFTGVVWQTAQLATPPATVFTYYIFEASNSIINGYVDTGSAALWSSLGGTLAPSPTVDVVSVISKSVDNPGNVALSVDTEVPWTGGNPFEVKNNGTNKFTVSYDGEITSYDEFGGIYFFTSPDDGGSGLTYRRMGIQSPDANQLVYGVTENGLAALYIASGSPTDRIELVTTNGLNRITMVSGDPTVAFNVDNAGDVTRLKGVDYIWPLASATGTLLNDGAGGLSWTGPTSGGSVSQVWTNIAGVIQPSDGQTTNILSFTSGAADNPTNVAMVVDTELPWTDAVLQAWRNGGTNYTAIGQFGAFYIGSETRDWWQPGTSANDVIVSHSDVTAGGPTSLAHFSQVDIDADTSSSFELFPSTTGVQFNMTWVDLIQDWTTTYAVTTNGNFFSQKYLGTDYVTLQTTAGPADVVMRLDTPFTHSSGNLAEVANNGTNVFTIDFAGSTVTAGSSTATTFIAGATNLVGETAAKVTGPASATDNAIARFDGTTGKLIQNSAASIADTTGALTLGDGSQTTTTFTANLSGTADPVVTYQNGGMTLAGGSISASESLWNATQTWNDAGDTFTALKLNVTSTASASASMLMDLQVGSVSKFKVVKDGGITGVNMVLTDWLQINAGILYFGSGGDVVFLREAANTFAHRNGNADQVVRWYSQYTGASDYERGALKTSDASYIELAAETSGTGGDNLDIRLTPAGTGGVVAGIGGTKVLNIRHGISGAMVGGAVTVTDTGCTANTRYFFTTHTLGTITLPSSYYAGTRTASTSFVINSSQITDTSTIDWMAIEP